MVVVRLHAAPPRLGDALDRGALAQGHVGVGGDGDGPEAVGVLQIPLRRRRRVGALQGLEDGAWEGLDLVAGRVGHDHALERLAVALGLGGLAAVELGVERLVVAVVEHAAPLAADDVEVAPAHAHVRQSGGGLFLRTLGREDMVGAGEVAQVDRVGGLARHGDGNRVAAVAASVADEGLRFPAASRRSPAPGGEEEGQQARREEEEAHRQ